jgi:hypothetical protein
VQEDVQAVFVAVEAGGEGGEVYFGVWFGFLFLLLRCWFGFRFGMGCLGSWLGGFL